MSTKSGEATSNSLALGVVPCGHCQSGNAVDRRFCGQCGKPLYEKCPACGVECRTGEAFCGGCGIRIRQFLQERIDAAESAIARAAALEANLRLDDAVRTLRAVQVPDHRELTIIAKRIEDALERLKTGAQKQTVVLEAGVARIRELLDAHSYQEAKQMLDKLPPTLRTAETDELLAEATSKQRELAELKADIAAATENRQYLDLAPKIHRYLTLQPQSESVRRLAEKVRDNLLVAANKKLMAFEYKLASKIISAVPECAIDENTTTLSGRIAEFCWLVDDLQNSPIVDEPLLAIAKRFAKKAPGDQKNVERCSQLFRVAAERPTAQSKRFPATEWTPPPRRTHVGCAVDWLGGSERLKFSDASVANSINLEPGRYFVAVGLALQGVDGATIPTSLVKHEKQGLFGAISLGKRKATARRAWGIDIGESCLKVVRLVDVPGGTGPAVDCCDLFPHSIPLNRPEAEASRHRLMAETMSKFLEKYTLEKSDQVCVSFPSQKVLGRPLRLPAAAPKKLHEMVQFEAKQRIPVPLDELSWTYHSFGDSHEKSDTGSSVFPNTLLLAAKQREVNELVMVFKELQAPIHILQSDAVALYNFAVFEGLLDLESKAAGEPRSIALLDIGAAATNVVVVAQDRPWFRSFRRGGEDFTSAAARHLQLTKEQAEEVKFNPSSVRRISDLHASFEPLFIQLADEIQRSLESFHKETGRRVSHIFGVGGGFRLHGLLGYLRNGP
ncbi:MAG: pilus assembly protein PilM [Planctomycetaceae bacterium]|nr:pilus assembly protein PilM [Planctomycetales bacterium]MCB9922005.1 pilus assembly protein PilM [Planctomycetaceae bacterium]